jgi:hypothetical protein
VVCDRLSGVKARVCFECGLPPGREGVVVGFLEWVLVKWAVEAEARNLGGAVQMLSRDVVDLFRRSRNACCKIQKWVSRRVGRFMEGSVAK